MLRPVAQGAFEATRGRKEEARPFNDFIFSLPHSNFLGSSLKLARTPANRSASSNVFGAFNMTNYFKR